MDAIEKKRILIVDDNAAIHRDFFKILSKDNRKSLDEDEAILFGLKKTSSNLKHKNIKLTRPTKVRKLLN